MKKLSEEINPNRCSLPRRFYKQECFKRLNQEGMNILLWKVHLES